MRARDVMTTKVVSVKPDARVEEIARKLIEHRISAVPVIDASGAVVGIVSEGDLMRRPESETERHSSWWLAMLSAPDEQAAEYVKGHGRHAKDVMTRSVVTVDEDAALGEVADILERQQIKRVPVLRDGNVVGIVSRANLLQGLVTAKATKPVTADDETIRTAILEALKREAGVRDQFVNVTVSGGTVHLWGALQSEQEKTAARLVAENTEGVRKIEDHLGVIPPQVRSVLWAE
jgi:CBS domain-containing protein